jgi:hypothetical protein
MVRFIKSKPKDFPAVHSSLPKLTRAEDRNVWIHEHGAGYAGHEHHLLLLCVSKQHDPLKENKIK